MPELGVITEMTLAEPKFSSLLWKATPASMAVRLSGGRWVAWNYLQLLSRKLVDVAMGRCPRLIVTMPPRHGKSESVSHYFPAWYLENFPEKRVILCSYEAEFAAKWGGKVRDTLLTNQEYLTIKFKSKNPSMHYWETEEGGAMMCAGVGGPITGKGANVMIIDDFVKNAEDGNSPTMRQKTWEWWLTTARTRLEPGGSVVVMATRWHSDDLIGRLINPESYPEKGLREEWEVFNLPALAEPESDMHYAKVGVKVNNLRASALTNFAEKQQILNDKEWVDVIGRKRGQALCPDRYNEDDLAKIRGGSDPKTWYALYQQRPGDETEDGNVYFCFDEVFSCKRLDRDHHLPLFISLDFNVDPMCAVIGQYDPGLVGDRLERVEVLEEIILKNSNTYAMCEVLIEKLRRYRTGSLLLVEIYGDAAGTQKTANSKKTNWQIVADHFVNEGWVHPKFIRKRSNPNIVDRVNAVNGMLKSADGTRRMFLDPEKCVELMTDFKKVKWQVDSGGNSTGLLDKSDGRRTHISDALGYMVDYKYGLRGRSAARRGFIQ